MKKILVWTILVFLFACDSDSTVEKTKTLKYFEKDWSYEWERVNKGDVNSELINKCITVYNKQTANTDKLLLDKVYRTNLNSHSYLVIQFDFEVKMDIRVVFVYLIEEKEIVGYFERSLA